MGEFPVNSLVLAKICRFWAEFDNFATEFETSPVISPVLARLGVSTRPKASIRLADSAESFPQNSGEERQCTEEISTDISNHSKLIQQTAARVHRSLRG